MALDESVRQFVDEVLELRLIHLMGLGGEGIEAGIVKMRLMRLWSFGGLLRGGVGRIEPCELPRQQAWITFSSPKSDETFDFTTKLGRYHIHLSSDEPQAHAETGVPIPRMTVAGGFGMISRVGTPPMQPRYPRASDEVLNQLEAVPTAVGQWMPYRPCDIVLKNGQRIDRVYVVPEEPYILMWGVWPEDDKGKESIRIDDVAEVHDSRHRLPARFAEKLYAAGESGMGYTIFTVLFADGSHMAIQTGNAIDFITYPAGKGPMDVVDVVPHVGREDPQLCKGSGYFWCLYAG